MAARHEWRAFAHVVRFGAAWVALFALIGGGHAQAGPPGETVPERIQRGRELFIRAWEPGDVENWPGDGLGPMFNAVSCAECHHQGHIGGAGSNERNVTLLTRITPLPVGFPHGDFFSRPARLSQEQEDRLAAVHPAFRDRSVTVVVLHSSHPSEQYGKWRRALVNQSSFETPPSVRVPRNTPLRFLQRDGVWYMLSQRGTPALFGAARIDRVQPETLVRLARSQSRHSREIAGIVPRAAREKVGRFGWRGQVATLREFVETACAVELGLQVQGHPQAMDILDPKYNSPDVDLTAQQVDDLVAFVESIPPPRSIDADDANVKRGKKVFRKIGCADCHVESLDEVQGLYSDLLLHDMGPALADTALPSPTAVNSSATVSTLVASLAQYYGASGGTALSSQWRTPPLWGVGDSAPYLHDGRAKTLEDAILAHGGQAARAVKRFRALPRAARQSLIDFLESLAAPEDGAD